MQGDGRSNTALKSTYGSMESNGWHQAMQTGTVPSKLARREKKLNLLTQTNIFYTIMYIIS